MAGINSLGNEFSKGFFFLIKMKRKENIAYIEQKLDLFNLIIYRI